MSKIKEAVPYALVLIAGIIIGSTDFKQIESSALVAALITAIASFSAALAGAHYAFKLQEDVEQSKIRDAHVVAGNLAIFNLELMWRVMNDYKEKVTTKAKKDKEFGYTLMKKSISYGKEINIDLNTLSFLIKDHIGLLVKLRRINLQYQLDIDHIREFSDDYNHKLLPILKEDIKDRGFPTVGITRNDNILKEKIGNDLHMIMQTRSGQIIASVEEDLLNLQLCVVIQTRSDSHPI